MSRKPARFRKRHAYLLSGCCRHGQETDASRTERLEEGRCASEEGTEWGNGYVVAERGERSGGYVAGERERAERTGRYDGYENGQQSAGQGAGRLLMASENAIIYRSEMEFVSRCILDYPNIETGGQMFGYWKDDGTPVVLYTIGPGPRANHQVAFFNQDIAYLEAVGNVLTQKYGLQHMGEWHSHHSLGLAHPSGHDASSMANGLAASGRNRFLLCIGNYCSGSYTMTQLNPFNFVSGRGTDYVSARWTINPMDSPFRELIDRELRSMLYMPETRQANYREQSAVSGQQAGAGSQQSVQKPMYDSGYWLSDKSNNIVLKNILDFLGNDQSVANLKPMLDEEKHVVLLFDFKDTYNVEISFPKGFPYIPPVFRVSRRDWRGEQTPCNLSAPEWIYNGNIYQSFVEYFQNMRIL